ncbi:linker for activation of T-cells family member 2 isoform X4 [Tursiops truncatus]|uniref:linker for activation of T-cells family member 2 isoform X4 n=1 Tax=Tursiops truncatus TaxID=9739 RepID=UPI003CCF18C5
MSVDTELLWSGAALLLLLGAAAGLCVRCSPRAGAKRSEKIYEQRSLQENQQNFAVARTYTRRTSCCSSPPASRSLHPPGTRTSAKEVDAHQMHPTYTPSPWTILIVGGSRSPRKMKMTPIPMRTCSSVSQRKPNQGTRSLRVIRTQHPSGSGGSPGESWEAQTRTTGSPIT